MSSARVSRLAAALFLSSLWLAPSPVMAAAAGAGQAAAPSATRSYACPINGFERSVTVTTSATGCDAIYRKEGGVAQTIWHSDHHPDICLGKAAAFVDRLKGLGISCTAR